MTLYNSEEKEKRAAELAIANKELINVLHTLMEEQESREAKLNSTLEDYRTSHAKNKAILSSSLDSIITIDRFGLVLDYNKVAHKTFGWEHSEIVGRPLVDFIIPDELREAHTQGMQKFMSTGDGPVLGQRFELTAKHKDGHVFPIEISISEIDAIDSIIFSAFIRDITKKEKRAAELAIAHKEKLILIEKYKKMATIVQTTTNAALITDSLGRIEWVNQAFLSNCGYTEDFVMGRAPGAFLQGPLTSQNTENTIREATKAHKDFDVEILNYKKSGEIFWSRIIATPISNEEGFIGYVSIQENITEKIIVDKMKAEFVATAAHELRTPMTIIFGYVELMKNGIINIDNTSPLIDVIYEQSQTMIDLLDNILDMAKIEAQATGIYNTQFKAIGSVIKKLTDKFISSTNHKKIILNIDPNLPDINIDKDKIEQLINNLLSNADKYSPENDEINMKVSQVMREGINKLLITIEDHGIGMTPEELKRVYEKFYRADKTGKIPGTGLGMSIVKDIATQHRGTIEIESQPGVGTKVMLYLPIA